MEIERRKTLGRKQGVDLGQGLAGQGLAGRGPRLANTAVIARRERNARLAKALAVTAAMPKAAAAHKVPAHQVPLQTQRTL